MGQPRPRDIIPQSREGLRALYVQHGSWPRVAEALGVALSTLATAVRRYGLRGNAVDRTVARSRLPAAAAWVRDRDELCRRLAAHGSVSGLALASGVGENTLRAYIRRHGITPDQYVPDPADYGVQRYDTPLTLEGDWVVTADYQAPYTDQAWVAAMCRIGRAWGIANLLVAGDLVDLEHFARYDPIHEPPPWESAKQFTARLLRVLAEAYPGHKVWTLGNHELRLTRLTRGKWSMPELAAALEAHDVRAVQTPTVHIETPRGSWGVVHPKSYSVIPTAVGKDLAAKFHRHTIVAHGHHVGFRRDPSGKYRIIDLGAMCDPGMLAYVHTFVTRHPIMNRGFVLLRAGVAHLVQPDDDLAWWERVGKL